MIHPHGARGAILASLCALAGGCASPQPFAAFGAERGVFASPYVAPEISQQGIRPEPEGVDPRRRPYLDSLTYLGRGRALDRNGRLIRLSRNDRRLLGERAERLHQRAAELERARGWQRFRPAAACPACGKAVISGCAPVRGGGSLPR